MTGLLIALVVLQSISMLALLGINTNLAKLTDAVFRGRR